jgi:sRNA-binding protein
MTAADFMEDRVALDGEILKCNQDANLARSDLECANARIAVERLASQQEALNQAKAAAEFERSRQQLRSMQEQQRQEEEARKKVDAYHLPLVPVDPDPPTSNVAAGSPR